jgi:phospholipase A1
MVGVKIQPVMNRIPIHFMLLALLATTAVAQAQQSNSAPATPEACIGIDSDAMRLACYDAALGRKPQNAAAADATAAYADLLAHDARKEAAQAAADENTKRKQGAVFGNDAPYRDAIANAGKGSLLDSRWELAKDSKLGIFQMRGYKPVYLLPAFWTSSINQKPSSPNPSNTVTTPLEMEAIEAKFQLSFKTKVAENLFGDNGDLWTAYTQTSRWQVYNGAISRPFRETNYEPEAMLVFRNNYTLGDWHGRMFGIGVDHQSNGQSDPLSRSWNRVIANIGLDRDNWAFVLRPWWRIPEDRANNDNPDIENYVGRADAMLVYSNNGQEVSILGRHSLRTGAESHGAVQMDWGFPINRSFRGHLQFFHGYGESMIDYNHEATYIGLGISLLEWF